MASKVTLLSKRSVITMRYCGSPLHLTGRSVMKSIVNSLWKSYGTGKGNSNLCLLERHTLVLPQTSQFLQKLLTIWLIPGQKKNRNKMAIVLFRPGYPYTRVMRCLGKDRTQSFPIWFPLPFSKTQCSPPIQLTFRLRNFQL